MKNAALASLLIIPSIINIAASSAVIGYYNGPPATPRDAKYNLAAVYLVAGILGVLIALYTLIKYKDSNIENIMIVLGLIWSLVTAAAIMNAQSVIGSASNAFLLNFVFNWIIFGVVVVLQLLGYFTTFLDEYLDY